MTKSFHIFTTGVRVTHTMLLGTEQEIVMGENQWMEAHDSKVINRINLTVNGLIWVCFHRHVGRFLFLQIFIHISF